MTKPNADTLAAAAKAAGKKGPPPVHLWNPPFCGDIDMRIARDGTWFYLGTPIGRAPLVNLFSSILKREGDAYFLVTPVEKVGIRVDDAPLLAIDFDVTGTGDTQTLTFTTKTDDTATLGPDHPLRVERDPGRTVALSPDPREPLGPDRPQILLPAGRSGLPSRPRRAKVVRSLVLGAVLPGHPLIRAALNPHAPLRRQPDAALQ